MALIFKQMPNISQIAKNQPRWPTLAKITRCCPKLWKMASAFELPKWKVNGARSFSSCLNKNWIKIRCGIYKAQSDQIMLKIGKIDSHLLRRCILESEWWNSWQSPHHSWYSWHWKFVSIYISLSIHFSHQVYQYMRNSTFNGQIRTCI